MIRKFNISVNGKEYDVEVTEVIEGQTAVQKSVEKKNEPICVPPPVISTSAIQKEPEKVQSIVAEASAAFKIIAPMPGTILKINFEKGQSVKKGQVVLILEAMKMENEITAPKDGIIASMNVTTGSKVNSGDVMLTM